MQQEQTAFEGHAIIELMGHNMIAGYVSEQSIAGVAMLRVDVPATETQPAFTKFFGGAAVYGITPTTEEIAAHAVQRLSVRPISTWVVPDPVARPALVDTMTGSEPEFVYEDDVPEDERPF